MGGRWEWVCYQVLLALHGLDDKIKVAGTVSLHAFRFYLRHTTTDMTPQACFS